MSESNSCSSKSFKGLMTSQFLGALNDNIFRTVVKLLITAKFVVAGHGSSYLSIAQGLFVLPFILFSGYAGWAGDRYSKVSILKAAKVAEVIVALVALYFFYHEILWGLFACVFLMGVHSTFYSPAKYGILPEILDEKELSRGNGYLELWTFVAVVLGIIVGGIIKGSSSDYTSAAMLILVVAVVGFFSNYFIRSLPALLPTLEFDRNPFRQTWASYRSLKEHRGLHQSLLAMSYFWFVATCFDLLIYLYAKEHLGLGELGTSVLLTSLMLGIGFGSIVAGKVSEGRVELGIVPIGGIGIAICCMLLDQTSGSFFFTAVLLAVLGLSAGFFIVPLNAYYQYESPPEQRGRYLALSNFTSFSGMLLATLLVAVLTDILDISPRGGFLWVGLLSIFVAIYVTKTLPNALIRCVNWIVTHFVYRIKVVGEANLPEKGGALLVANHVSFVDALLVLAMAKRSVRFLMFRPIYENKFIKPIAETMGAIPVGGEGGSKDAIEEAKRSIERGELVCIFAEGAITRIGHLLPFRSGLERIMDGLSAPIIPVYLDQLWGSIFSFRDGKFFWKIPREFPYPMTILFGTPLPGETPASEVRKRVQDLSTDAFRLRKRRHQVLHLGFLAQAKRTPFRKAVIESSGGSYSYFKLLAGVIILQKLLQSRFRSGENVGILLPPGAPGAIANLTVLSLGAVPVNLNHTVSREAFDRMISKAGISTILTANEYLKRLSFEKDPKMLPLEALYSGVTKWEMGRAAALALALPKFLLRFFFFEAKAGADDLATIMFSSGSTGDPKGVMLTHGNIASNLEGIYELLQLRNEDSMLGSLPLFHSFGFTGTLFLPLLGGISVVFHPNPVDAGAVTKLIKKHNTTLLLTTPTFLQLYARKAEKEDLAGLRYIILGAEKLREGLRKSFEERFDKELLEGYGCTELSPVAFVNVPDVGEGRSKQQGNKPGTVGQPLPGISIKIVNPETFEELKTDESGLLLVKGPNVMKGYLNDAEKTAEVLRDGFYVTGDIASVDKDGFVTIQDRLSRFSKIGGEMVPHLRIEEELHSLLGADGQVLAVGSVPDEKRGERLVVLTTVNLDSKKLTDGLAERGLPNLWIPKAEDFYQIEALPVLGTGKLDLRGLNEMARAKVMIQ